MTKKHFIALAEEIKFSHVTFLDRQLEVLAAFCKSQNPRFDKEKWIGYIKGTCGPEGEKVKTKDSHRERYPLPQWAGLKKLGPCEPGCTICRRIAEGFHLRYGAEQPHPGHTAEATVTMR